MLKSPQKATGQEKHLKALMRKIKEMKRQDLPETPELLKEFEVFFSAKKEGAVNVNESLHFKDADVIEIGSGIIDNPVFAGVAFGYIGLLEIFLKYGANLFMRSGRDISLPMVALNNKKTNSLKWLLDKVGYTKLNEPLLRTAITRCDLEAVRVIVEHPSFDILVNDDKEIPCLTYAVMLTQDDIVRYLVEKGAKFTDYFGYSPYDYAVTYFVSNIDNSKAALDVKGLSRKSALKTMQVLLESENFNAARVIVPSGPKTKQCVWQICGKWLFWDLLQGLDDASLVKIKIAVRLWLMHGAGLCFQYVTEGVKKAYQAERDAEILVMAKDNVIYYKIAPLVAAIRAEPQRFYLRSLSLVCLSEREMQPQLIPLLQAIQEVNKSRVNFQDNTRDSTQVDLLIKELNQFDPYEIEEGSWAVNRSKMADNFKELHEGVNGLASASRKMIESGVNTVLDVLGLGSQNLVLMNRLCYFVCCIVEQEKSYAQLKMPSDIKSEFTAKTDEMVALFGNNLKSFIEVSVQLLKNDVATSLMREAFVPLMQAMVRCLLYIEKRLKRFDIEATHLIKIDAMLAITSALILSRQPKIQERQLYLNLCQRIVRVKENTLESAGAAYVLDIKRKTYIILADNQMDNGYYANAAQYLRCILLQPNFKRIDQNLQVACLRYMRYSLARQYYRMLDEVLLTYITVVQSCQNADRNKVLNEAEADIQGFQQAVMNKLESLRKRLLPIEDCVIAINEKEKTLEISSSKLDNRIINLLRKRYPYEMTVEKNENNSLLKCHNIHWVFEDDLFALLALLQVELRQAMNEAQNLQETANKSDNASPPSSSLSESFMAMSLYAPSYRSLYSRAPQKRVKVISILDNKEQAPIEENPVLSSETVNRLLQMPRPGLSPLIMIRSDNGGFPDNTHFLCIKESEEFETFLKTLRSRDVHVAYSIPEKGLEQRGVKISHDHQEARVKIYGDARAVGNCTSVIDPETGCTLRLYVVDRIETHKERARAKKHGVKA